MMPFIRFYNRFSFNVCLGVMLSLIGLIVLSSSAFADLYGDYYYFPSCDGAIIEQYYGPGGAVVVPSELVFPGGTYCYCNPPPTPDCQDYRIVTSLPVVGLVSTFNGRTDLTSVYIPDSVKFIHGAFMGCTGLTSVDIPDSVTRLGIGAFFSCTGLTSVCIPNSVTSIESSAFAGCTGLTSVVIGSSVTSIDRDVFEGCTSLSSAGFLGNAPSMVLGGFDNCASDFSVCYTAGATGFTTPIWSGYPCSECTVSGCYIVSFLDKDKPSRNVRGAAADGTSKVIIKIKGVKLQDNIEITIPASDGSLLNDGQITDGEYTRTYVAPKDFNDTSTGSRPIDLTITVNDTLIHPDFYLVKPPVVLVHGLWSNQSNWEDLTHHLSHNYFFNMGNPVFPIDYCNDCSFADNQNFIHGHLNTLMKTINSIDINSIDGSNIYHDPKGQIMPVVVKKADIVAHSMGGILASLYIASSNDADNVNRFITIGTPFSGSQLANYALNLLYNVLQVNDPVKFYVVLGLLQLGKKPMGQAVFDLQVNSEAINNFISTLSLPPSKFSVPVYPIIGNAVDTSLSSEVGVLYAFLNWIDKYYNYFGYFDSCVLVPCMATTIFCSDQNDLVVSSISQQGGSPTYEPENVAYHTTECQECIIQVTELLNSPIDQFNSQGFKPAASGCTAPIPVSVVQQSNDVMKINESHMIKTLAGENPVFIISPQDGSTHTSGETIHFEATCIDTTVEAVFFFTPFGWFEGTSAPYEYDFTVDNTFIGQFEIGVLAVGSNGIIGNDSVTLYIDPTASLQSIRILPFNALTMSPNDQFNIYVKGIFSDGITRDLTSQSTTQFTSLNPAIATIDQNGLIAAVSPGVTVITVQNTNVTETINITVEQSQPTTDTDGDGVSDSRDNCPNTPNPLQDDSYPPQGNNCGDACECEGNFDGDSDTDSSDAATLKVDLGRSILKNPCSDALPCKGDFTCDSDVDSADAAFFKTDLGRSPLRNPCPICEVGAWCVYP